MISLLDSQHQYILAEATRSISLQSDTRQDTVDDKLWLGSIVIPREQGVCQTVLTRTLPHQPVQTPPDPDDLIVINDLRHDPVASQLPLVQNREPGRFYAGAPIRHPDGTTIGVYCVFDDQPRQGLDQNLKIFLRDMTTTVIDHLEDCRARIIQSQNHKLLGGLESFVGELSSVKAPSFGESNPDEPPSIGSISSSHVKRERHPYSEPRSESPQETSTKSPREELRKSHQQSSPDYYENVFSRAASIIQTASDFDGVVFVDATSVDTRTRALQQNHVASTTSSKGTGTIITSQKCGLSSSSADDSSTTDDSIEPRSASNPSKSEVEMLQRASRVLSIALSSQTERHAHASSKNFSISVRDLKSLVANSPEGDCFMLNGAGQVLQSDASSSGSEADQNTISAQLVSISSNESEATNTRSEPHREKARLRVGTASTLTNACHGARSLIFLPLWDYDRHHWSAACICWTSSGTRDLKHDGSLSYLRIFGTSIMHAISRLRALEADQAKTTFVASISHELRSPLHGILGNVELLYDTSPNRGQLPLVESIAACGRTLLDTVDHVLDFAKINTVGKYNLDGSRRKGRRHGGQGQEERFHSHSAANGQLLRAVHLGQLTEELIDSVLAAQIVDRNLYDMVNVGYTPGLSRQGLQRSPQSSVESHNESFQRGAVKIILEIARSSTWTFRTEPGAWKRILMNLLGNSLKYTNSGFVQIGLTASEDTARPGYHRVVLSVKDSGIGMSTDYLRHRLYTPFSQEDPFAPGTGLGLSIVRQLVSKMKGTLEVKSEQGFGTTVRIEMTLHGHDPSPDFFSFAPLTSKDELDLHIQDKRAIVLNGESKSDHQTLSDTAKRALFYECDSIGKLLKDWFHIDVEIKPSLDGATPDIVVCTEPSFTQLETIRKLRPRGTSTLVIFVARDALEAAVLGTDARLLPPHRDVKIITQPCGPAKLKKAFIEFYGDAILPSPGLTATRPKPPSRLSVNGTTTHDQGIDLVQRLQSRQTQASQSAVDPSTLDAVSQSADQSTKQRCLIVDDNVINRRVSDCVAPYNLKRLSNLASSYWPCK